MIAPIAKTMRTSQTIGHTSYNQNLNFLTGVPFEKLKPYVL